MKTHKGKSSRLKSSFRHYGSITVGFWSKKDSAKNVHTLAYICTKDFITTKFKIGYFFFTNHYTIAAAKVSTESRLKNVAVTSFWFFEEMFLHKLYFFFQFIPMCKKASGLTKKSQDLTLKNATWILVHLIKGDIIISVQFSNLHTGGWKFR